MYKAILTVTVVAIAIWSQVTWAFEGIISFKSDYWGEQSEFQYYSKEGKSRIETNRARHGRAAVILDVKAKKVSMLLLNLRLAMVMNMDAEALLRPASTDGGLARTGRTMSVLGYQVEGWLHTGEDEDTEIWGATGLGLFVGLHPTSSMFGRGGGAPPWVRAVREQGLFPLIVIRKDKNGKQLGRMDVTAVESRPLPDQLFEVPRWFITYDKFDPDNRMPGMPGTVWLK